MEVSPPSWPLKAKNHSPILDLRPANVLLGLRSLDGLEENEVLDLLGEPYQATVHLTTRGAPNAPINPKYADLPKYLVYPVDWRDVDPRDILAKVHVTDFGLSFSTTAPLPHRRSLVVTMAPARG
jgi:serine/threonine-protein kinase SRPK3